MSNGGTVTFNGGSNAVNVYANLIQGSTSGSTGNPSPTISPAISLDNGSSFGGGLSSSNDLVLWAPSLSVTGDISATLGASLTLFGVNGVNQSAGNISTSDLYVITTASGAGVAVSNNGSLNNGGDLFLNLASPQAYLIATTAGNIYTSQPLTINTADGNVVLASGVSAAYNSGSISLTRSGMGGNIYFYSNYQLAGFTTNGGNVTLIAMTDGTPGSANGGQVNLQTNVEIDTYLAQPSSSVNGNVTVIAEATEPTNNTIQMGSVNANSNIVFGTGGGGAVTVKAATPNLAGVTINDLTGAVSGSFDGGPCKTAALTWAQLSLPTAISISPAATST